MIPALFLGWQRFIPHLIVIALVAGGIFYVHQRAYNNGQADVQEKWDSTERERQKILDKALADKAAKENEYDLLRWKHNDAIKAKLAADSRANTLAARLRDYYRSDASRALSRIAAASSSPDGAAGTGTSPDAAGHGVDLAVQGVITACRADSLRLQGFQQWYEDVSSSSSP